MADETKVEAQAAAEAPAKVAEAVAETAETIAKESAKTAKRTRAATARRAKRQAAAEGRDPPAPLAGAKIARRKTTYRRPQDARAAKQRIETMTNNNFFKGFEAVPSFAPVPVAVRPGE